MGLPDFSLPSCPPPKPLSCQTRSGENCLGGVLYPGLCGSCRLRFVPSAHITIQSPAHSPLLPWRCFIHGRPAPPRPQDGSKELSRLSAHSWLFLPGIQLCPPLLLLLYKSIVLFCFGLSCCPHGGHHSHPGLNQKSPVLGVLLPAFSSPQHDVDLLPREHKQVYLIVLEF